MICEIIFMIIKLGVVKVFNKFYRDWLIPQSL